MMNLSISQLFGYDSRMTWIAIGIAAFAVGLFWLVVA